MRNRLALAKVPGEVGVIWVRRVSVDDVGKNGCVVVEPGVMTASPPHRTAPNHQLRHRDDGETVGRARQGRRKGEAVVARSEGGRRPRGEIDDEVESRPART